MTTAVFAQKRKPGDPTPFPSVFFSSPFANPADGWAIATRAFARAMHLAGVAVRLWDYQNAYPGGLPRETQRELGAKFLEQDQNVLDLHLWGGMICGAETMVPVFERLLSQEIPTALYCVFERWYLEPRLAGAMRDFAGIFTQCRTNHDVLDHHGVDSTYVPFPFFPDDLLLKLDPPRTTNRFYSITRFEPRKAPDNIIRAFMRAFKPGETHLSMKLSATRPIVDGYCSPESVVLSELARSDTWTPQNWRDSIRFIYEKMSGDDMVEFHSENDIYVTASRGEGLDLGAWAAKLASRRVVSTMCGGPEDFLDPEVDLLVPRSGFIEADPSYPWGEHANYVDYDIEDLSYAMQLARGEENIRPTRTWPGWQDHHADNVGKALKEWAERCAHVR